MAHGRLRKGGLAAVYESIGKIEKIVNNGNYYEAQQMYKSIGARDLAAKKYSETLDIFQSGSILQLKQGQVTCGAELAFLFVDTLVKGKFPVCEESFDRVRKIYQAFPRILLPQRLAFEDDMQKLSEAFGVAKTCVDGCSSFLKAAIRGGREGEIEGLKVNYREEREDRIHLRLRLLHWLALPWPWPGICSPRCGLLPTLTSCCCSPPLVVAHRRLLLVAGCCCSPPWFLVIARGWWSLTVACRSRLSSPLSWKFIH